MNSYYLYRASLYLMLAVSTTALSGDIGEARFFQLYPAFVAKSHDKSGWEQLMILGLIGAAAALLLAQAPFGFVAILGVIALAGMIMRNSVILVDQIKQDLDAGHSMREAIVGSAVRRFRPIMLTAAAAVLALVPLAGSLFWGPMALAMMGGLVAGTILTLTFLPALYALSFGVDTPSRAAEEAPGQAVPKRPPVPAYYFVKAGE